eukprot:56098_1
MKSNVRSDYIDMDKSDLLMSGYIREIENNIPLAMKMQNGISLILSTFYFIPFKGSKLWCCGTWECVSSEVAAYGTQMMIAPPSIETYVNYPLGHVHIGGGKSDIDGWVNDYSFILYDHKRMTQVVFSLSHVLYKFELNMDKTNHGFEKESTQWMLVQRHPQAVNYYHQPWSYTKSAFRLKPSRWTRSNGATLDIFPVQKTVRYNGHEDVQTITVSISLWFCHFANTSWVHCVARCQCAFYFVARCKII